MRRIILFVQNLFGGRGNRGRRPQGDGTGGRSVVNTFIVVVDDDGSDVNDVQLMRKKMMMWVVP